MRHPSALVSASPSEFVYGGSPHRITSSFTSDIFDTSSISSSQTSISSVSDYDDCHLSYRCTDASATSGALASSANASYPAGLPSIFSFDASVPRLPIVTAPATSAPASHNPRRTGNLSRSRTVPTLVRQSERKINFVDTLVESATLIVEAIWPLSAATQCQVYRSSKSPLKLRTFIEETLRRSRTSYSTLQVAMYYLILIKPHISAHNNSAKDQSRDSTSRALQCGRRMFLISLILASKYLQDRNYSAKAWSKISGLPISEINQNEIAFLQAINWKLHLPESLFSRWTTFNLNFPPPPSGSGANGRDKDAATLRWQRMILDLDPEITNVDLGAKPSSLSRMFFNSPSPSPSYAPASGVLSPMPRANTSSTIGAETVVIANAPIRRSSHGHMSLPPMRMSAPAASPTPSAFSVASNMSTTSNHRSMALAMECANATFTTRNIERYHMTSSPSACSVSMPPLRRSPLATQPSTSSSPASMISDDSRSMSSVSCTSAYDTSVASASLPCLVGAPRASMWNVRMQGSSLSRSNSYTLPDIHEQKTTEIMPLSDFSVPTTQSPISFVDEEAARILHDFKSQPNTSSLKSKRSFSVMSYENCGSDKLPQNMFNAMQPSTRGTWPTHESELESTKRARYNRVLSPFTLNYFMPPYPTASA
ncbi:uncharacterized protein BROUX77_003527 [Berkeleyomyces rouxiae]|uniref:uncharacterized protein n=1 Tax=Berkeleyomyces rouxiae TaxID=2035830 RepID=UPI003B818403